MPVLQGNPSGGGSPQRGLMPRAQSPARIFASRNGFSQAVERGVLPMVAGWAPWGHKRSNTWLMARLASWKRLFSTFVRICSVEEENSA